MKTKTIRNLILETDFFELLSLDHLPVEERIPIINTFSEKVLEHTFYQAAKNGLFSKKDRQNIDIMIEQKKSSQEIQQYIIKAVPKIENLIIETSVRLKTEALIHQIQSLLELADKGEISLGENDYERLEKLIGMLESEGTDFYKFKASLNSFKKIFKEKMK
ncbi:hypothetical protein GF357_02355 [Candidatus Dojkabacteria bacterium]|nr:hypothetical protein [Candidatus Dojkabacteria bacterium]